MERSCLPLNSGEVSYIEREGGFPVVFLHGLGGSGNNWLRLSQYLPGRYRLIMPDLAGHGRTKYHLEEFSLEEQVRMLGDFVKGLGLERFAVVGNSYGGWLAMRFCAAGWKPDYVILLDSAGINPTVGESTPESQERFVDRVMNMNPRNDREVIRRFVEHNATGKEKLTDEELSRMPERTLIVWGRKDRLIPLEYAEKLHEKIRGSGMVVMDDAGHTPHSTNARELASIIGEFIDP